MSSKADRAREAALFVAVLAWGGYTLVMYLGAPAHARGLLSLPQREAVMRACGETDFFCRGLHSFLPFLGHAVHQAQPFLWYILTSFAAVAALVVWNWARRSEKPPRFEVTPLHIIVLFVAAVWLMFTVLGLEGNARMLAEPTAEAYPTATPATVDALRANFRELNAQGCLGPERTSTQGIQFFQLEISCMQRAFLGRVMPQILAVLLFGLELLVLGRILLNRFGIHQQPVLVEAMLSTGLGACGFMVLLWLLGVVSALRPGVVWLLVVVVPLAGFRHTGYWLRQCYSQKLRVDLRPHGIRVALAWILTSLLALHFLHVVRPLPVGFDDLNSYLMRPRMMAALGQSLYSTATFQWEFLTSLGFVLFGHDSTFGTTAAMMVNWSAGALAIGAILAFGRSFLGAGGGLLAACLYYSLPLVSHFSYADMKVDNAVFFVGTLAVLAMALHLFRPSQPEKEKPRRIPPLLVLAGLFAGFAVAMKLTASMLLVSLALTAAVAVLQKNRRFFPAVIAIGVFGVSAAVGTVPWLARNNLLHGNIAPRLVIDAPRRLVPPVTLGGVAAAEEQSNRRTLPPELAVDVNHPNCTFTGRSEELDRYWGPGRGAERYLTLWWRAVMNADVGGFYVTLVPVILLAPLVLLLRAFWTPDARWARWLGVVTVLLLVQWAVLANGVPWYGVAGLLGILLGMEYLVSKHVIAVTRYAAGVFVALSIAIALAMRFTQFSNERAMLDYALGKLSAPTMQEVVVPHYGAIRDSVLGRATGMPERPYLYRVGTYIPYFLADSPQVLGISDNQLSFFNCVNQERNGPLTLRRLQALGFNSIIFDTGTASIEQDSNGSLHDKVAAFVDFANDPALGIRTVINDPRHGVAYLLLP